MVLEAKTTFLDSLSDDQLGFFHAHEYNRQLENMLQDKITYKQFILFKEWKDEEEAQSELSSYESDAINALSSRMEILFEGINKRMEQLERKIEAVSHNPEPAAIQILTAKIEKLEGQLGNEKPSGSVDDVLAQQADSMRAFASKINERMENVEIKCGDIAKKVSVLEGSAKNENIVNSNNQATSSAVNERMDQLERAIQDLECAKIKLKIPKSLISQLLEDSEFQRFTLPSDTKLYIEDISSVGSVANAFFTTFTLSNKEKTLLDRTINEIIGFLQKKNYLNARRTLSPVIEKMISRWSLEERAVFQRLTDTYFDSSACSIHSWNDELLALSEVKLKALLNSKSIPSDLLLNKHI